MQFEGAVNADGRGATIWDTYSHMPGNIEDGNTGDVADDFYHQYAGMPICQYANIPVISA